MISVENRDDETRITIHSDLDGQNRLAVDLTGRTFIHSAGVSLLANLTQSGAPCRIVVASSGTVRRVLEFCGFGRRLTVPPERR